MKLEHIGNSIVERIYKERMVIDFPKDELKPLGVILDAIDSGRYECLGLFDGDNMIGYVFLVKLNKDYLVDYLAIYPDKRNAGAGSVMVNRLADYLKDADNIIVEVENPDYADDEDQEDLQSRRLSFYLRNGCSDTGLRAKTFDVPFRVLSMGEGSCNDVDALWELYESFNKEVLPNEMFEKNIKRQ
jgi:GNAT superfamily N-acetyltransferase